MFFQARLRNLSALCNPIRVLGPARRFAQEPPAKPCPDPPKASALTDVAAPVAFNYQAVLPEIQKYFKTVGVRSSYGSASLVSIRGNNEFYADRTQYLQLLVSEKKFNSGVLLRPSRFGKTLFLNTIQCYFDVNYKSQHDDLFGGLYVEKHPLPLKHSLHVLLLTLPSVPEKGETYETAFKRDINTSIQDFVDQHQPRQPQQHPPFECKINANSALDSLGRLRKAVAAQRGVDGAEGRLLILVDEYDRAVMTALAEGGVDLAKERLEALRPLLNFLKTRNNNNQLDFFVTGITPLAITGSIFNNARNFSLSRELSTCFGLAEAEVRDMLERVGNVPTGYKLARAMRVMRKYFNGYNFLHAPYSLFNPQLIADFAHKCAAGEIKFADIKTDAAVEALLSLAPVLEDDNQGLSTHQVNLAKAHPGVRKLLLSGNPLPGQRLQALFDIENLNEHAAAFLYNQGQLTLDKPGSFNLRVPNAIVEHQLFLEFRKLLVNSKSLADAFLAEPTADGLAKFFNKVYDDEVQLGMPVNDINESALQRGAKLAFNVHATSGKGHHDLCLRMQKIIIELKNLRMKVEGDPKLEQCIILPKDMLSGRTDQRKMDEVVGKLPLEDLLKLKVRHGDLAKKSSDTLNDLVLSAEAQVLKYLKKLPQKEHGWRAFTVLQVGKRCVVHEVFNENNNNNNTV